LSIVSERLRVLMLATYFPKPGNPLMGTWALSQAQALQRQDLDVKVVSLTSWIPKFLARTNGAAAYADCPQQFSWGSLNVEYPRGLWYPVRPFKDRAFRDPQFQMNLAWSTANRYLANVVKSFKPDVTYAHHTAVNGFFAERLRSRFQVPFVITDHDFGEIADCARWPARRSFFAQIVSKAFTMVFPASRMETETKRLFPDAQTRTIPNGTDPIPEQLFAEPRPEALRDKVILFSCGAFYERKGFPLLIEAFAKVAPRFPHVVLRIAGDGADRQRIDEQIQRFSLQSRVELLGFQPHQKVLQEMCWCDAFVLVGWDEPFATVYSEAMSAGKPVICCNDGGINDVLRNEVHGLTVSPKNVDAAAYALERIVSDNDLRSRLGTAAKQLFETSLRWDHNARQMADIFRDAAAQSRTRLHEPA
jgi:glycosyltransferase involved in cell wall biosynthesis